MPGEQEGATHALPLPMHARAFLLTGSVQKQGFRTPAGTTDAVTDVGDGEDLASACQQIRQVPVYRHIRLYHGFRMPADATCALWRAQSPWVGDGTALAYPARQDDPVGL